MGLGALSGFGLAGPKLAICAGLACVWVSGWLVVFCIVVRVSVMLVFFVFSVCLSGDITALVFVVCKGAFGGCLGTRGR